MNPLLFLLACAAPASIETAPDLTDDTAPPIMDDSETVEDTEEIEGEAVEGMCALSLRCDGPIVDEPKVGCDLEVSGPDGRAVYSGRAGVDLRGRSSAVFPKPQYAAELWDEAGEAVSVSLGGMGRESDWILNGAYIDRVLFRNKLAFDSFQAAGEQNYGPESAYCTLTLDDRWVGIYLLTERIKRDDDRVDLAADDSGETFVVKLDDEGGVAENSAGYGTWQLVYPREDDISGAARSAVSARLEGWQRAVYVDPQGLGDHVDVDSMIDFILVQEMTRNTDAYFLSVHLSRAPGERLRLIPWDSDLTLGQPSYNDNENPEGWIVYRPDYIAAMASVPGFHAALAGRWRELRGGAWSDEALGARMDGYRATMGDVVYDNFEVWPIEEIEFGWDGVDYLYPIDSYDAEYEKVRGWLPRRLVWLDAHIDAW